MPFIDARIAKKLTDAQKDALKERLGKAISVIGKPESYTMIGIIDGYTLYFGGKKLENGAYVAVDILGDSNPANSAAMTEAVCNILGEELGTGGQDIYVEYRHTKDWGWNGTNF